MFPNFTTKEPNPTQLVVDFKPCSARKVANLQQVVWDSNTPELESPKKKQKQPSFYPCWLIESLPEEEQTEFFGTAAIKNGGFWE